LASTFSTHNSLGYAASAPRKDQAVAVMRGFVLVEISIHCIHHTIFLNSILPLVKVLQAYQSTVTLGSGHFGGAPAENGPPSITAVEAQHSHHFAHDLVVLHRPSVLQFGVQHALQTGPEEPNGRHVGPKVAELSGAERFYHLLHPLLRVALSHVHHLQLELPCFCHTQCCCCEFLNPLQVFSSIQAHQFSLCHLSTETSCVNIKNLHLY